MRTMLLSLGATLCLAAVGCAPYGSVSGEAAGNGPGSASSSGGTKAPDAWPMVRGDRRGTGFVDARMPASLRLLWKFTVDEGAFVATPAVVDDVVFIGDLDGVLIALDLSDGAERWKFKTDSGFSASPSVRGGRVYLGDIDGRFYAIDAATGKQVWRYETESQAEINSSANFYKSTVLFGSQDGTLYALSADTGAVAWKHTVDDQIRCSPTVVGDVTFLAGCDSKFHVVNVATGKPLDTVEINDQAGSTPAADGDFVYFGTEGGVFFAINFKKAKIAWQYPRRRAPFAFRSSAALTDQLAIVGGRDKRIHAVDRKTGRKEWTATTRGRVDSSPVVVGNHVYVGSADGRLYTFDVESGKRLWDYEAGGSFSAGPAVVKGKLLIASDDGVVYCFGE